MSDKKVEFIRIDVEEICKWFFGCCAAVGIAWAPVQCHKQGSESDNLAEARIETAIKSGVDPIDAACTYKYTDSLKTQCAIRAAIKGEKK